MHFSPLHKKRLLQLLLWSMVIGFTFFSFVQGISKYGRWYYHPTDLIAHPPSPFQSIRLMGTVVPGSIDQLDGLHVRFSIADQYHHIPIDYHGLLPPLFQINHVAVLQGHFQAPLFVAQQVLARHDARYQPVASA